ncbi:MAG: iron chaperone [Vicinamibacterales bacterium]
MPRNNPDVTEYIAGQPGAAQPALKAVRKAIRTALPDAEEVISYQIPAFRLQGRIVLYFAGWKSHYSLYPATARLAREFAEELAPYEASGKGTIRFPLDAPVPARLIARIAKFRAKEIAERMKAKRKTAKKRQR